MHSKCLILLSQFPGLRVSDGAQKRVGVNMHSAPKFRQQGDTERVLCARPGPCIGDNSLGSARWQVPRDPA